MECGVYACAQCEFDLPRPPTNIRKSLFVTGILASYWECEFEISLVHQLIFESHYFSLEFSHHTGSVESGVHECCVQCECDLPRPPPL